MKKKNAFTLVELLLSMLLLSFILLFIHGLINNIVFSKDDNYYNNSVSNILISSNISNDLIKYGLLYQGDIPVKIVNDANKYSITFKTILNTSTLTILKNEKQITYSDVNQKKYTWSLENNLSIDIDNIVSNIDEGYKDSILYTLVIPIYDTDEDQNTNVKENDIIINYFGKKITS